MRRLLGVFATVGLLALSHAPAASTAPRSVSPLAVAPAATSDTGTGLGEAQALAEAAATGSPVGVDRLRTGTTEVFANPDGSFTAEIYVDPVRVRKAGAWVAVDSTLVANADGTFSPRASVTDMRFSGGGSGPLFSVTRGGVSVDVSWPGTLPAPVVSGDTAKYREVYPGVDLEVTAAGSSVTHRVVAKTRQAGADPRVRSITYGQKISGGKRVAKASGSGFVVTDNFGETVFESPEPIMWDSSTGTSSKTDVSCMYDTCPTGGGEIVYTGEPQEGNKIGDVQLALGADASGEPTMTVTPSADVLDSSSTTYPVAIDPTVAPAISNWAMVDAAYSGVSYYKYTSADQGVGYQNFNAWSRKRLFYGFGTSGLNTTQVSSATFSAFEVYSATCAAGSVDAYLSGNASSGTTWNSQPARITGILSSFSTKAGRSDCLSGGTWGSWDVTAAVKNRVAAKASMTTIQLAGRSESTYSSWMRFAGPANATISRRPKLSVTYNNPPAATPTTYMKAPTDATACATSPTGAPRINPTSSTAYMYARAYDAQGGTLYSAFRVSQGTTGMDIHYTPAFTASAGVWTAYQKAPLNQISGLVNGTTYNWDVVTRDATSGWVNWSAKCYFIADTQAPTAPTITTSVATDQLLPATQGPVPVTFYQPEAASFSYSVAEVPKGYVTASSGTANVNADVSLNVVRVSAQARDAALNVGPARSIWLNKAVPRRLAVYSVLASDPPAATQGDPNDASLTADWRLPVGPETGLEEGRYGRCGQDPALTSCAQDKALAFAAGSPGIVGDHRPVRTDDSLTVGAWVYVDENTGVSTILQQDGDGASNAGAYTLAFNGNADSGQGRFAFTLGSGTSAVTAYDALPSGPAGARLGGWTYVAGSYDKTASTSYPYGRIWVTTVQRNGWDAPAVQVGGAKVNRGAATTQSTGSFYVGDSGDQVGGNSLNPLHGRVDELSTWQAAYDSNPPAGQAIDYTIRDTAVIEPAAF